jgi:ribosomal protein L20
MIPYPYPIDMVCLRYQYRDRDQNRDRNRDLGALRALWRIARPNLALRQPISTKIGFPRARVSVP